MKFLFQSHKRYVFPLVPFPYFRKQEQSYIMCMLVQFLLFFNPISIHIFLSLFHLLSTSPQIPEQVQERHTKRSSIKRKSWYKTNIILFILFYLKPLHFRLTVNVCILWSVNCLQRIIITILFKAQCTYTDMVLWECTILEIATTKKNKRAFIPNKNGWMDEK